MIPTKPGWYFVTNRGKRMCVRVKWSVDENSFVVPTMSRTVDSPNFTDWSAEIIDPKTLEKK